MQNENEFDLLENETACSNHFDVNGFSLRLVLTQEQKATQEWPIVNINAKTEQLLLYFCFSM